MGYKISVNGEKVWESKSDHSSVDRVTVTNVRGEVAVIGSATGDEWLAIEVNERPIGLETYLDTNDLKALQERQVKFDKEPEDMSAYVEADPETGQPMEKDLVETPSETPVAATTSSSTSSTDITV